jgi:hypothetical protein
MDRVQFAAGLLPASGPEFPKTSTSQNIGMAPID